MIEEFNAKIAALETDVLGLKDDITEIKNNNKIINDKLDVINQALARQKGFLAGIIFVFSALAGLIGFVIDFLKK